MGVEYKKRGIRNFNFWKFHRDQSRNQAMELKSKMGCTNLGLWSVQKALIFIHKILKFQDSQLRMCINQNPEIARILNCAYG